MENILILAGVVVGLALFIRIWRMTNDVAKMKTYLDEINKHLKRGD